MAFHSPYILPRLDDHHDGSTHNPGKVVGGREQEEGRRIEEEEEEEEQKLMRKFITEKRWLSISDVGREGNR